jgi:hypothetical protein
MERRARPFQQEKIMKNTPLALVLCVGFAVVCGNAFAANATSQQSLKPITVHQGIELEHATQEKPLGDCTPPNSSAVCSALHAQIRNAFTQREISMLFGAATPLPEYRATYSRVNERYRAFVRDNATTETYPVALAGR